MICFNMFVYCCSVFVYLTVAGRKSEINLTVIVIVLMAFGFFGLRYVNRLVLCKNCDTKISMPYFNVSTIMNTHH